MKDFTAFLSLSTIIIAFLTLYLLSSQYLLYKFLTIKIIEKINEHVKMLITGIYTLFNIFLLYYFFKITLISITFSLEEVKTLGSIIFLLAVIITSVLSTYTYRFTNHQNKYTLSLKETLERIGIYLSSSFSCFFLTYFLSLKNINQHISVSLYFLGLTIFAFVVYRFFMDITLSKKTYNKKEIQNVS